MSNKDDSAIDAMVDEVMAGRAAAEAAVAPPAFIEPAEEVPVTRVKKSGPVIGYAEEPTQPDADADADADADEPVQADAEDKDETTGISELRAERDSYLADSQRLAADFANFRKQSEKRVSDTAATQSAGLVRSLLPVLDACDSALDLDGESAIGSIRSALIGELERNGLELLAPAADDVFDPEQHEAVMHEPASPDSGHDGPVISEVLRAGYLWKGRVVRPAMVKVIG